MRKFMAICIAVGAIIITGCNVVVTPASTSGWFFLNEGANGSGQFVNGPGNPPEGRGSALLTVDGTGREAIATTSYTGQALANISQLQYSTYQAYSGSPSETPNLEFDVDYDSTDSNTTYQGRLVYVPSAGGTVVPDQWQTWNTMSGGAGAWYSSASGSSAYRPIVGGVAQANPPCTQQAGYCTWAQIMSYYPHATIRPTVSGVPGLLLVRAGGPITGGFVGATDGVIIKISGLQVDNNFEPGDGNVVVNTANASNLGFGFLQETATGSGSFVNGPNGSDGTGSAQLNVDATGGEALANGLYAGTRFDHIKFLSYKTYQQAVGTNAPTLQFDTDYDSTDSNTSFQGRLVFEPSLSGQATVTNGVWQTWNPLTAPSGWWQTGNAVVGGVNVGKACTEAVPCSFAQVLAAYPDASIRPITQQASGVPVAGGMYLKAGGGWSSGFTGNVDDLTIAVNVGGVNGTATYNFEP
jgi:hypothetical protein